MKASVLQALIRVVKKAKSERCPPISVDRPKHLFVCVFLLLACLFVDCFIVDRKIVQRSFLFKDRSPFFIGFYSLVGLHSSVIGQNR